jgi:CubicO group peptidase (beta-lactamase class C family)
MKHEITENIKTKLVTIVILICAGTVWNLSGQNTVAELRGISLNTEKLPRSIPELEGVSSDGILNFLNAIDTGNLEVHSYMFIRHGKVIAEGWWKPYGPGYKHLLYSASKTFTATGIGLAVAEGRLKVTDKVISFFPYSLPDSLGDYMKNLTVENLLTMSVGQDPEPRSMGNNGDWITTFLSSEPVHKPGTVFKYNNMATFMLSAIVQQVTGQTLFDYLKPRIFQPLGIRGMDWDLNPQGINLGMIGLRLRTEDLAKFGQLLLQGGIWNKRQLIAGEWVKAATTLKIESNDPSNKRPKESNDWAQGYCYQMWRTRDKGFRLDGMAGQFVLIYPDKDVVIVLTSNTRSTQDELNLVHNYLIPAIKSERSIPENPELYNQVLQRQSTLSIKPQFTAILKSELEAKISGREFLLTTNEYRIESVYFKFTDDECSFAIKRDNQIATIKAGFELWKISNSPLTSLLSPPRNNPSKSIGANYEVPQSVVKAGTMYSWTDPNTLEITARFVENDLGSQTVVCTFSGMGESIGVTLSQKSPSFAMMRPGGAPQPQVLLRGTLIDLK